jgi:thioredoxin reductase (NADPH)
MCIMNAEYDMVIIGCGPAGLSAAINAKARNKHVIVLGGNFCSPKLHRSPRIDNYLGLPGISGEELRQRFLEHVEKAGVSIRKCKVISVFPQDGSFLIQTEEEEPYSARAVILALGVTARTALPGEKEFLGRGVSYCATCDALLYKGKTTAVLAYEKEAEEEAKVLAGVCQKVYYLPQYKDRPGNSLGDNVEIIEAEPTVIEGEKLVEFLNLEQERLQVDGIFIVRESVPVEQLVPGIKMSGKFIQVDSDMAANVPGIFAAGDCVGEPFQLAKAVGQGQIAALSAAKYLS